MLFNSYIFILFFLPVALFLYFGLNRFRHFEAAKIVLIVMSVWFYAYFRWSYVFILMGSVLVNYLISKGMDRVQTGAPVRKGLLIFGIALNIGVIGYYKYLDFVIENIKGLFRTNFTLLHILMPLGISFFTFQQISYLVDSYRGETKGYRFTDYTLFVTYFPQLVAGPIVTHEEMIPQFANRERKKFSQEMMAKGLFFFAVGLFKKVILADTLGKGVDWAFANPTVLSGADVLVTSVLYTFQIYLDFSGYCDMACGIASMFNIQLPVNFNSPYKALSIGEFWKRWHMSLTRFLTKYLYIPLGGNRKGKMRTLLNVFLVFLISGLWHGASWTFILWGALHGLAQVLYRVFGKIWDALPKLLRWGATFAFVNFTWIIFRANSWQDMQTLFGTLFTWKEGGISAALLQCFEVIEFTYPEDHIGVLQGLKAAFPSVYLWVLLLVTAAIIFFGKNLHEKEFKPNGRNALGSMIMLLWSILSLSGLSSFLYFNF